MVKMSDRNSEESRYVGWVVKFHPDRGFGFIKSKNGQRYFVHISQIVGDEILHVGDMVEFNIEFNKRANKEQATKVLVMENS